MRKINKQIFLIGIISMVFFIFSFYVISKNQRIRTYGDLVKAPIVEFSKSASYRSSSMYCSVSIEGQKIYAGAIDEERYSLGDSIYVRYITGVNRVVQERVNPKSFYIYYSIASILLFLGIVAIIESFKGKKMSEYKSYSNEEILELIKKKVRRFVGKK